MLNDWSYKNIAIVEADDFMDRYDRNGLEMLFFWKAKYPNFKITLFTIPYKTSPEMLNLIGRHSDWIEIAIHGFNHESNFECYHWDEDKAKRLMYRVLTTGKYQPIFRAPGWCITPDFNGYPAATELLINKDKQAVYKAMASGKITVFDRHYNASIRPDGTDVVCVDCQTNLVHCHTWDMETGDAPNRNGFRQVEEEKGVPWDNHTQFYFVSEALELKLFKSCTYGKN